LGREKYGSPLILGGLQKMPSFEKKRFEFDLYARIGIIRFFIWHLGRSSFVKHFTF